MSSSSSSEYDYENQSDITQYSDFFVYFLDTCTASDQVLKSALIKSARQFCLDTELWEEELTPINVVANTASYSLVSRLPEHSHIICIAKARYGEEATDEDTNDMNVNDYQLDDETTFTFLTTPTDSITDGLVVTVVLRPAINSVGLPTSFGEKYFEPIMHYAKYLLFRQDKNKAYADPQRAQEHLRDYTEYVTRYRRERFVYDKPTDVRLFFNRGCF